MKVIINGKDYDLPEGITLFELIKQLKFDPEKIVVEKNLDIIKREEYEKCVINENDRLEILRFVGGG